MTAEQNDPVQGRSESGAGAPHSESGVVYAWATIKKHKVVEWTLAYIAFAYALLHGVEMAREAFDWPTMVPRLTIIVLIAGVPIASTLSYYHGHRAEHRVSRMEISILATLLVMAGTGLWWASRSRHDRAVMPTTAPVATTATTTQPLFSPPVHSVAVLPFTNLSGDPKQEYFSDGMSEELINALTQIDSLQVIARTSSFSFKGQNVDIETIGRKLNAGAILEGSIRRVGNTVRITAQLIDARNGIHLWSQDYDRDLKNVLAMQSEIATVVAQQLQAKLLGDEAAKIESGGTHNPTAYDAHLRGEHILANPKSEQDYRAAIEAADEAIAADPQYAEAYLLRAWAHELHGELYPKNIEARNAEFSEVLEASRHAVMLDPSQGEAHVLLADTMMNKLDFSAAESEFNRAISLSPGNAVVQDNYGFFQINFGHLANSLTAMHRAIELDPQNSFYRTDLPWLLLVARRPSEALAALRDAAALNPDSPLIGTNTWEAYYLDGRFDLAAQYCEKADSPLDEWVRHFCLANAYHGLGKAREAREQLEKAKALYGDLYAYYYAGVYAQFGETRNAIDWLLKAERVRDPLLMRLKIDPLLDPIRDEPAFKSLVRRMNFPP